MDELRFVIKCLVFASLLMIFSQVKVDGLTYEARAESFLTRSEVAFFMQEAAAGGTKAIKKALGGTKAFLNDKMEPETKFEKNSKTEDTL